MLVKNLVNNGRAVANQFVIADDHNCIFFQSYESTIIKIDYNAHELVIYPDYDYSRTTTRHRNNFLYEYGFSGISDSKSLEKAIKTGNYNSWTIRKVA
jgi:hypothetical protein